LAVLSEALLEAPVERRRAPEEDSFSSLLKRFRFHFPLSDSSAGADFAFPATWQATSVWVGFVLVLGA